MNVNSMPLLGRHQTHDSSQSEVICLFIVWWKYLLVLVSWSGSVFGAGVENGLWSGRVKATMSAFLKSGNYAERKYRIRVLILSRNVFFCSVLPLRMGYS